MPAPRVLTFSNEKAPLMMSVVRSQAGAFRVSFSSALRRFSVLLLMPLGVEGESFLTWTFSSSVTPITPWTWSFWEGEE